MYIKKIKLNNFRNYEQLELDLNKDEQEKLNNSCKIIKEMRENSIDRIIAE